MNGKMRPPAGRQQGPQLNIWSIVLTALLIWWGWSLLADYYGPVKVPYNEFRSELTAGNVDAVTVKGDRIRGELKSQSRYVSGTNRQGDPNEVEYSRFVTYVPSFGDEELFSLLKENNVKLTTEPAQQGNWWITILSLLPLLLIGGLVYMQYKRMSGGGGPGGGLFSIGKSRARLYDRTKERTQFEDVAGAEGAKAELMELVAFLRDPSKLKRLGGEVPKGVLLVGAPGTGKTLLARAVAGEAEVPFFSISGSDFMEMFVGVGASRVRDMFKAAKKDAPSIIFIDELDSIGRMRGAGLGGGHDEREQTLNQILSEMDGFEPNENVIVISATNRPDILDPALVRPGRFDRRIIVDLPSTKDRTAILKIYAKNKPLADDVDLEKISRGTPGFSGADLENLLNEAALLAARHDREDITLQDVENARDKVLMGLERQGLVMTEEEKRVVAYHEAGHALPAAVLPCADPVHKVSIVPRTRAMGVTQQFPEEDKYIYRREYLLDRLAVMMGGRAAEELVFNTSTSGAGNDLKEAAKLARKMVLEWGMSETFKHMALGAAKEQVFLGEDITQRREYSETTAREVDEAVKSLLQEAGNRAMQTLQEKRKELDAIAEALLEKEEILGDTVLELLGMEKQNDESKKPAC